jgi:hypothetical protein
LKRCLIDVVLFQLAFQFPPLPQSENQ